MTHDDDPRGYASPPCSLHEFDHPAGTDDVAAWRRSERKRLIALRRALGRRERAVLDAGIERGLDTLLGDVAGRAIAVYWPIRGEPDLRGWCARAADRGARLALPVVQARNSPLLFCRWRPGERLVPGALKIPVPAACDALEPAVILSPLVGYDRQRHRLGNGGGYYDRTLAALAGRPLTIGVGYERCALRSIYPQSFDVPMDYIVTESSVDPAPGEADWRRQLRTSTG